uniref:Coiled-coil domain-containing protein 172 n=1 Tax=Mola mola TaxID=94237 RepID=A0A3Q3W100_MOLML
MSLNTLIEQILLSEQQLNEQTERIKELSQMRLQYNVMKKCHDQMLKLTEELLAKIKRQFKVEEESFWQEITVFNSDFSLRGNRDTVVESQTQTEILDLDREVESLYKKAVTESLKVERMFVRRKPLTDSTCLLRKELDMYKSGELELRRDLLNSEMQFLKS